MAISNQELLRKATMTTSASFGGATQAPLTIEQIQTFLRLAITPQAMLPDVRTVMSNAAKWQESKIDFANRVMRPGTEGVRLADSDRTNPTTGIVEIDTVLLRGEVPISDEVMEDQVERQGFGDTVMAMIAEAAGRDIEELFISGATTSADPYLALQDGWLVQAQGTGANVYDATNDAQDYQAVFRKLLSSIAPKYKRDPQNMRFYVPTILVEKYRENLAARGTPLGDMLISGTGDLIFQGIGIKPVPLFPIATGVGGAPDVSNILLSHRQNLYAGFRREVRMETWRDPREGATSFVVTTRVNSKIAHVPATAIATNVNVSI